MRVLNRLTNKISRPQYAGRLERRVSHNVLCDDNWGRRQSHFQQCPHHQKLAFFCGSRPSSNPGAPFWPSGLTLQSSGLAYGQPLTLAVSHHEQIVTLRINRLVMPTTRWVLRNVSPHQVSKHYSLARRKTTRCRTATHTREYCKIIRLAAKPPLGLAPRNRHLRASNLTDAYAF